MEKNKNKKKSKLSLDDLKKKGNVHNETLAAISGGGLGIEARSTAKDIVDGDMPPPK